MRQGISVVLVLIRSLPKEKIWICFFQDLNSFGKVLEFAQFCYVASVFNHFRETDRKYVFEISSAPIALRDQTIMVHLMSRKDAKLAAVELREVG